ncbi:MAG: N-acetylmuramoyl-L-alanine amidase [Alphaproteobacteria bacterium]
MMRIVETPSPNHGPRPDGVAIDMLVLHYTGMQTGAGALARLCDPVAEVSAHYTVDMDGTVHAHVAEERRAWQAGPSHWRGRPDVNSRSIGIEIVNTGHDWGLAPFPAGQIAAVIALSRGILARHAIQARQVVAHSDIAPNRKADPGELFPWRRLAAAGVGLWPGPEAPAPGVEVADALVEIGYGVGEYGFEPCLRAFQRRWRPARIDGLVDAQTARLAAQVLHLARTAP